MSLFRSPWAGFENNKMVGRGRGWGGLVVHLCSCCLAGSVRADMMEQSCLVVALQSVSRQRQKDLLRILMCRVVCNKFKKKKNNQGIAYSCVFYECLYMYESGEAAVLLILMPFWRIFIILVPYVIVMINTFYTRRNLRATTLNSQQSLCVWSQTLCS